MSTKSKSRTADRKAAWKDRNDRGPHTASFPSGVDLTFVIPNETQLIRADRLPDHLTELAAYSAAYPGGADAYMEDVALAASRSNGDPEAANRLKETVQRGLELRDWLIAEMLVDPKVTPEEVAAGDFPDADIAMLLEFAERRRNTDAAGKRLPIVVLGDFARFRDDGVDRTDGEARGGDTDDVPGPDAGPDGGAV